MKQPPLFPTVRETAQPSQLADDAPPGPASLRPGGRTPERTVEASPPTSTVSTLSDPATPPPGSDSPQAASLAARENPRAAAREATTYQLAFAPGYKLLSANDRMHHLAKARAVKQIRKDAVTLALYYRLPRLERVAITAVLHPRDKRHQDADNVQPTVKAAVDGLVAAGFLPQDDERHVVSITYVLGEPVKGKQLVLHIEDLGGAA